MIRIIDNSKDRLMIRNLISNTSTCARGNKVRMNIWSIKLAKFSVILDASKIKGLKPCDLIKFRDSLDLVLLTSEFILMSPRIIHFLIFR